MDNTIFSAVVRSFLDMGGNVVDFNITDSGVLEEAKKIPENIKSDCKGLGIQCILYGIR